MKKSFLLVLVCLSSLLSVAQLNSRPVGLWFASYNGTTWVAFDSATFKYAAGNPGYFNRILGYSENDMMCDTIYHHKLVSGVWTVPTKTIYYRNSARLKDSLVGIRNTSTGWKYSSKTSYVYDGNGNLLTELLQRYDTLNSLWVNLQRVTYVYGGANVTDRLQEAFISSNWVPQYRYHYSYTGSNLDTVVYDTYNTSTSQWERFTRTFYLYHSGNGYDTSLVQRYRQHIAGYRNTTLSARFFNSKGLDTLNLNYNWDTTGMKWDNNTRRATVFNTKDQAIEDTSWNWSKTNNIFEYTLLTQRVYGVYGTIDSNILHRWNKTVSKFEKENLAYNSHNADTFQEHYQSYSWSAASNNWVTVNGNTLNHHYFETKPVDISQAKLLRPLINIYPNPAAQMINISISGAYETSVIAICNMSGVLVRQWEISNGENYNANIPVSDLTNGNYILSVRSPKGSSAVQFTIAQ